MDFLPSRRTIVHRMSQSRAAQRRATWFAGVAHSASEADELDVEFWMNATPEERILGVAQLTTELQTMEGSDGSSPRLQRTLAGVRPRER